MQYLSYEVCSAVSDNFAQFDKKAKMFGKKVKSFAKFFAVLCLYLVCNVIISFLFSVRKSISIETFRLVMEGVRGLASQDLFFYLLLFYQSKINYVLVAIAFVCSIGFFIQLICPDDGFKQRRQVLRADKNADMRSSFDAPVFSYKLNVAFLA